MDRREKKSSSDELDFYAVVCLGYPEVALVIPGTEDVISLKETYSSYLLQWPTQ